MKTDYKKIDLYRKRPNDYAVYVASTTWARNLWVARKRYAQAKKCAPYELIAVYSGRARDL